MLSQPRRRDFLKHSLTAAGCLAAGVSAADTGRRPRLKKAVKYAMIREGESVRQRFALIKSLGFLGVEIDCPSPLNLEEAVNASKETGIAIHGVIDSVHWRDTLSSPDAATRARGLAALRKALEAATFVGADTVLLVPGVVNKEATFQQCWDRSQAEIKKAIPLAEKLGVKIAVEVVWNDFITTPQQLIDYVDAFKTPAVGAYFDCSNMIKYGTPSATWIRKLGKRMLKFDFKGYSKSRRWVPIGEGDEDWPEILKACAEIGYNGWATAEVQGGGRKELQDVADRMNRILQLT